MDRLEEQVRLLNNKLDTLHEAIGQLIHRLSPSLPEPSVVRVGRPERPSFVSPSLAGRQSSYANEVLIGGNDAISASERSLDYRDVLIDDTYLEIIPPTSEKELTPEIQVQRLTAQLTAAYNRIAGLEEQLLARRIH